ncbi:MAG TPA: PEGA domain-containing protein [Methanoregula sp.]|nr:PEGA domain-containing protein [Methanoregula sp.]
MIRKILILTFISILLAGCIAGQPAEKGTLQLTSTPAGAEVYFDNQYRGSTPSTISDVEPGNHTLEFRMNGYRSWKSVVTVPSGTSNFFAALTVQPALGEGPVGTSTMAAPAAVTLTVASERMIIGDSNEFYGTATGTSHVTLTLFGPGYYANGIVLDQIQPGAGSFWSYTWSPGTKVQSRTYTLVVHDAAKTVSARAAFTAIGNGEVSVTTNSYAIAKGETIVFSGRCSTGASTVRIVLFGPDRFSSGIDLGNFPVSAEQTWSFRYITDLTMPTGIYSVYASDVPQTATGSSQFTIGYTS